MTKCVSALFSMLLYVLVVVPSSAQVPEDYYTSVNGNCGRDLKTALSLVIDNHKVLSYSALWKAFYTTDIRSDGKVWDMYSSKTNYTLGTDQAGNYKKEGDCYNREHSFPKSWFNDASPMYTDLFHIVPTDGYVNGKRGNLPFGETASPSWSSSGGWSKLGPSSIQGYTGTVFEPNDSYKGDFARIYFYMATRYEDLIDNWDCVMLSGDSYTAYTEWALDMLLSWSESDPVSQKEIDRNEAVYALQGNRNPFVDFPGIEQYIWGRMSDEEFYDNDNQGGTTAIEKMGKSNNRVCIVLDLSGRVVARGIHKSTVLNSLPSGIYIVDGKKTLVR